MKDRDGVHGWNQGDSGKSEYGRGGASDSKQKIIRHSIDSEQKIVTFHYCQRHQTRHYDKLRRVHRDYYSVGKNRYHLPVAQNTSKYHFGQAGFTGSPHQIDVWNARWQIPEKNLLKFQWAGIGRPLWITMRKGECNKFLVPPHRFLIL